MAKTKKRFSYWVRLEELRMTEKQLCKKAGFSMWTLRRLKKGKNNAGVKMLILLADGLDCSVDELLVAFY